MRLPADHLEGVERIARALLARGIELMSSPYRDEDINPYVRRATSSHEEIRLPEGGGSPVCKTGLTDGTYLDITEFVEPNPPSPLSVLKFTCPSITLNGAKFGIQI